MQLLLHSKSLQHLYNDMRYVRGSFLAPVPPVCLHPKTRIHERAFSGTSTTHSYAACRIRGAGADRRHDDHNGNHRHVCPAIEGGIHSSSFRGWSFVCAAHTWTSTSKAGGRSSPAWPHTGHGHGRPGITMSECGLGYRPFGCRHLTSVVSF